MTAILKIAIGCRKGLLSARNRRQALSLRPDETVVTGSNGFRPEVLRRFRDFRWRNSLLSRPKMFLDENPDLSEVFAPYLPADRALASQSGA